MRLKLFLGFAIFVAIVLLIIAAFQTFLLEKVYRGTIIRQSKTAVENISAFDYNDEGYREKVYDTASKYGLCVSVYKISGNTGTPLVTAHTQTFCLIHSASSDMLLSSIYANAKKDGVYVETMEQQVSSSAGSLIAAKVKSEAGGDILTIVNSDIKPVDATVATLRWQLLYLSVILLAVSAIMAFFISKKFSVPVARMSEEAKKLALGNYDVNFDGGGFRETVELGESLNYAAGELSKLDTMQKELISNISHDLRTPLTLSLIHISEPTRPY